MANWFGKAVGFTPGVNSVKTEIIAGVTSFLTMAYLLAVNPAIFSVMEQQGMPTAAIFTATALATIVGTLVMALYAKKPLAVAPALGPNTFFIYTICLGMGYDWRLALTALFLEGIIFIILTLTNVRVLLADAIPNNLKRAISCGIGLFIAIVGLKNTGFVVVDPENGTALGDLGSPECILAMVGLALTGILTILNVKGSFLIGIIVTTLIGIPMGLTKMSGAISAPPSIEPLLLQFEWSKIFSFDLLIVLILFLSVDTFQSIGSLIAVSMKAGYFQEDGKIKDMKKMLMADAVGTTVGSCIGATTTCAYSESATGVAMGGKTGLTSLTTAICFAIALIFAPIFLAIPNAATGPVLIIVGVMIFSTIKDIDWSNYAESLPAFLTIVLMPLTNNIADGLMIGVISYVILNACTGRIKNISVVLWVMFALFVAKYIFL